MSYCKILSSRPEVCPGLMYLMTHQTTTCLKREDSTAKSKDQNNYLGMTSLPFQYLSMNLQDFMRAMAYFQPQEFLWEILVAMLHRATPLSWARIFLLACLYFPKDRITIRILQDYNLWHVRLQCLHTGIAHNIFVISLWMPFVRTGILQHT